MLVVLTRTIIGGGGENLSSLYVWQSKNAYKYSYINMM